MRHVAFARWHAHVGAMHADSAMTGWLIDTASLTSKLVVCCSDFRVRRLRQVNGYCLADEAAAIGLRRRLQVREREVLLVCDGIPRVYAHTVVPLAANASDWPFFGALGERSLGTTLFGDPKVTRSALRFARLTPAHPLWRRACRALDTESLDSPLYARRCLYRRGKGLMLVTEVFLPAIAQLDCGAGCPEAKIECEKA